MPDELRNTRRARLSGVRVTIEGATGERHQAEVADLSKEGLFIVSETPLAIGKRLSLEIYAVGEPAPWPALGRVVWTRETGDGEERPPGMGVKIIDIEDAAAEAVDRLLETRERTEPGLGGAEKGEPGREKTMLGVGVSAEPPLPAAPILVPAPGREATLLGVGTSGGAEPREPSVPIDLVAKRVSSAPPAAAPAIAREQVDTEPPKSRKRSKRRGGLGFLLLALLAACAIAAYALRDRLLTLWQQVSSTEVTTEAPRPTQAPVAAPAPSPTPTPTATVSPVMEAGAALDAARGPVAASAPSSTATATPPSSAASSKHPAATQPPAGPPRKPKSQEDTNPY